MKLKLPIIHYPLLFTIIATAITFGTNNAGAFLEYGMGASQAALGNAGVASTQQSIYWNPATLTRKTKNEKRITFQTMMSTAFETRYQSLSLTVPFLDRTWGVGYIGAKVDDIASSSLDSGINRWVSNGNSLSYQSQGLYLGTGFDFIGFCDAGVSIKILKEEAGGYNATGIGLDVGIQKRIDDNTQAGVVLENFVQPEMKWNTPSDNMDTIPQTIRAGFSTNILNNTRIFYEAKAKQNRDTTHHLGLEYEFMPMFSLRCGIDNGKFTFGSGLSIYGITFNFAWHEAALDVLDPTYRFSLGMEL